MDPLQVSGDLHKNMDWTDTMIIKASCLYFIYIYYDLNLTGALFTNMSRRWHGYLITC